MSLIRCYRKFSAPRGLKTTLLTALKAYQRKYLDEGEPLYVPDWGQALVSDLLPQEAHQQLRAKLVAKVADVTGMKLPPEEFSLVVHYGCGPVRHHADSMSKSCFLLPLRAAKTLEFFVEHECCKLHEVPLVRFNDYDYHGLQNEWMTHFVILSVTRDLR